VRLGDGTETSAQKMQQAVDNLWRFTAELFDADDVELALIESGAVDPRDLRQAGKAKCLPVCRKPACMCPKKWRTAPAARGAAHRTSGADAGRNAVSPARVPVSSGKENGMQRLVDIAPAQIPQIWSLLSQIPDPEVPV
jgi:hypothetical protein